MLPILAFNGNRQEISQASRAGHSAGGLPTEFFNDVLDRFDHVIHVLIGHPGKQREADDALKILIGHGKVCGLKTVFIPVIKDAYGSE